MEDNKNIFTKKNIIIGVSILLVIVIFAILLLTSGSTEKKEKENNIKCTVSSMPNDIFKSLIITADIIYNDEIINKIKYNYKYQLTQDIINMVSIETLKSSINKEFSESVTEKMNYNIESDNDTIVINFLIDYVNFNSEDFPKGDIFDELTNSDRDIIKFKRQVLESGGKCE